MVAVDIECAALVFCQIYCTPEVHRRYTGGIHRWPAGWPCVGVGLKRGASSEQSASSWLILLVSNECVCVACRVG